MTNKTAVMEKPKSSAHFILQGKGGVGKSLIAALIAQYFQSKGQNVKCIDTDPVNQTFSNYKALQAQHLKLLDGSRVNERNFDALYSRLFTEDGTLVIDNGASTFIPLSNYLAENNVINGMHEDNRELFIHCVVTGGQALVDTLNGFAELAKQTQSKNIIVWVNDYFGAVERDGKQFTDMKAFIEGQDKVRGIVKLSRRNPDTFGKDLEEMISRKLTFGEALSGSGFDLAAINRLKIIQKDLYSQLDNIF